MRAHLRHRSTPVGFTLIELLIVIIIIGILVAIGVPAYLKYTASANDRDAQSSLRVAYKAAISGDAEVSGSRFPAAASVVNDIKADEPAAAVAAGDCVGTVANAPVKQVLVDPSSTTSSLTLCTRSASGAIWRLTGPLTGTPTVSEGSAVAVNLAGGEITDAVRTAATSGDGLSADSSTGVWDATTNLTPNGGLESGTGTWAGYANGLTPIPLLTRDTSQHEFGAASMRIDTQGSFQTEGAISTLIAAAPNTVYTVSAWVKGTPGQSLRIGMDWKNSGAYISGVSAAATLTGSGWQRISDTATSPGTTNQITVVLYTNNGAPAATTFWADGIQLEAKQTATPYVETVGAAASRGAATVKLPATGLSTTQGWVAMRVRPEWSSGVPAHGGSGWEQAWNWGDGDSDELGVQYVENAGAGRWEIKRDVANSSNTRPSYNYTATPGVPVTVVAYWTASADAISVNGGSFHSAAGALVEPFTNQSIALGAPDYASGGQALDGEVLWFACGTGTLSDTDAATINSWGDNDPKRSAFSSGAQATLVWDGTSPTGSLR